MKIAIVPNDPLSAYSDEDRWWDRPKGYNEKGHDVVVFRTGETDFRRFGDFLKQTEPDVVRTLEGGRFVISAIVASFCQQYSVPFVPSLHGIDVECNIARKYDKKEAEYFTGCRIYALHVASAIIATQKSYVRYMRDFGHIGKTKFIPNYVDTKTFKEKCEPENRIIHVGRLDASDKDIPTVCAAAAGVQSDVEVLFVGRGPMLSEVERYGFSHIDGVPNSEIPTLISSSKVTLFADPPEYTGFGIPVMESQACKRPVVFCRSGAKEFIDKYEPDKDVSYFMDPYYRVTNIEEMATRIDDLIVDEEEWKKQGERGRKRIQRNFSRKKVLDSEIELYKEVIE